MIELRNVRKAFGDRVVLNNINLNVKKGDLISIMGKSGSGKTTLLNILGFLDTQTDGTYIFNEKIIKGSHARNTIRNQNMGFVFQAYNLIPKLTVSENISLPIFYSQNSKQTRERLKKIPELMDKFGLTQIESSYVECISGGEKQRVCLARALVCDANIIISDEPTGNLDEYNTNLILNEFQQIGRAHV